jgi:hypothetical protein
MKKIIGFAFLLLAFGLLTGCAKTVTSIVTFGDQMVVEITLRGTLDINNDRYFMVLSSSPYFTIPLPPPDNIIFEFIEPGMSPQLGSMTDYYTNYYSTWAGYTIMDPSGFTLVRGPFVLGVEASREVFASPGDLNTNKIRFTFPLERLFGSTVPDKIYFDIASVDWPAGAQKFCADHLTSTNAYISKLAGSVQVITDEEDPSIDPALDILSCIVTIQ